MTTMPFEETAFNTLIANEVALLGLPYDEKSSFWRGAAYAPLKIRQALHSPSANTTTESGRDIAELGGWRDLGDLGGLRGAAAHGAVERCVQKVLEKGARTLCLGGDHSLAYPILRAYGKHYPNLTVLQIDAHPDLYDEFEGDRYSHASPFARVMEEGLVKRLVQVGIRTATAHQRTQAVRFGVEMFDMRSWPAIREITFSRPLYVSLDIDALDPAFAPGVSHHEPGGLSVRELLGIIQSLPAPLVGADIVEYNPTRDIQDITAMVAAKCLRELLDRML
jgi:agmatinase